MAAPQLPAENSIPLRIMVCLMWIVAITASFVFGEEPVPSANFTPMQGAALVLSIWLCIGGGIFSYYYREHPPAVVKHLIKVGVALMIVNLARELFEANMAALQFQFVRPLMHALVASSVLTSFEMRTRHDIIQSATFGLLLLCVAAASGKSALFGGLVFLYICFGTALLMFSCQSQTRAQSVGSEERAKPTVKMLTRKNLPIASLLLVTVLPITSAVAFCVMPRMDNEADSFAAQMRTSVTSAISNWRNGGRQHEPEKLLVMKAGPNQMKVARAREELRHPHTDQPKLAEPDKKATDKITKEPATPPQQKKPGKTQAMAKAPPVTPPSLPPAPTPKVQKTEPEKPPVAQKKRLDESKIGMQVPMTRPDEPLFSLASNRNVYTRVMAMDYFDGQTWTRSDNTTTWEIAPNEKGVNFLSCPPMGISFDMPIMEVAQAYTIESDLGNYIPIAGMPQNLSLLQTVDVDLYSNVRSREQLVKGTKYSVVAQLPVYSLDAMRRAKDVDDIPQNLDAYLQIPDEQSKELYGLSAQLTGSDGNRFVRAERILTHLRKNYKYSGLPVAGADPSKNMVDVFLFDEKRGDCKAYASAFVMLCRAAEIPARFTMGYLPGDFDAMTGVQHVKRKHGHAWAEAWIPPNGWVPFDATPTGMLPARPEETYYNYQTLKKEAKKYEEKINSTGNAVLTNALTAFRYALLAAAFIVSLFALYLCARALKAMIKQIVREIRERHPALMVKKRVLKRLRKVGLMDTPSDSGAEVVEKLRATLKDKTRQSELANTVAQFMDTYNAAYFGNEPRVPELKKLESTINKLAKR